MPIVGVVVNDQVVVEQLDPAYEDIYQRLAVVDVVGVALGEALEEVFELVVFEHRALNL